MKVLTTSEMREVDRKTAELGIPNLILMENAGHRVVEFIAERFAPLSEHRIVVFCGKGNNGGDGFVVARQLHTRFHPKSLDVVLSADPSEMQGDAGANLAMLRASGVEVHRELLPEMRTATLVIDALLGTGLTGPARGQSLDLIRAINTLFPAAKVVAVDIPSGMASDAADTGGEHVRADATVTFTAPKIAHALQPNCDRCGEIRVAAIGSPEHLFADAQLSLIEPAMFRHLLAPRKRDGHKGDYGHVLVIAGSRGKTGAAAMSGMAALRAGAGLVTVASVASATDAIGAFAPELMTEPLAETPDGAIADNVRLPLDRKTVLAIGPGLGTRESTVKLVRRVVAESDLPLVVDADGLNALAGSDFSAKRAVLTPHPGEMARLLGRSIENRLEDARSFAVARNVTLVLKGYRTLIAFPDGRVWINPTGTPAMGTGGTGDILTGMISGFIAQFPHDIDSAVAAAIYLHGRAGQLGAVEMGEQPLVATDLLRYLPAAIRESAA